jgi:hypothetical protein
MYSFDCPVCIAYLEDLEMCDCCGQYVCEMCSAAFRIEATEINKVLARSGIHSDCLAVTVVEGEPVVAPAFRDAANYRRYVEWNALRMRATVDQLDALLTNDD